MSTSFKVIVSGLAVAVAFATVVAAQQPRIQNGAVTTQPAGSAFAQSFKSTVSSASEVTWIGYTVPVADGERVMCCANGGTSFVNGTMSDASGCCGLCRLENSSGTTMSTRPQAPTPAGVIKLEGSD